MPSLRTGHSDPPAALRAALLAVALRLADARIPWLVAGSAARLLHGGRVTPNDLDLEVAGRDIVHAARALGCVAERAIDAGGSGWRAGGEVAGVAVDLSAELAVRGPSGVMPPAWEAMAHAARRVQLGGQSLLLQPVEEQMARAMVRGDAARLQRIAAESGPTLALDLAYVASRLAAVTAAS